MKIIGLKRIVQLLSFVIAVLFIINCSSSDDNGSAGPVVATPQIVITGNISNFNPTDVLSHSNSQSFQVKGVDLVGNQTLDASLNFEVSLDDLIFESQVLISMDDANAGNTTIYVRFSPLENSVGANAGSLTLQSSQATNITMALSGVGVSITPVINVDQTSLSFDDTMVMQVSSPLNLTVNGDNIVTDIALNVTEGFDMSLDNITFANALQIPADSANDATVIYIRFAPNVAANVSGTLTFQNAEAENITVNLEGVGLPITHNYLTFDQQALAFGGGYNQSANQIFNLHSDLTNISQIKMNLQIECSSSGCDDWDRFANVKIKDPSSGDWYEIGRYITPYWTGTQQLERGLEFDVTDFKSLLTGSVELRIYIENWTAKADIITVDFDYIEGTPDYPYYAVSEVLGYHANSIDGVPYGVAHSFDLDKQITIPANAESTHLRTVISGWGHATPNDAGGRPCAEWCYRTHNVKINGSSTFDHYLGPIGCASNPISNQNPGNWIPDRAGWCPGMVVPSRIDIFGSSMSGSVFTFEYDFEDWTNDMNNGSAYYATSTYVVVKSSSPISKPTVAN